MFRAALSLGGSRGEFGIFGRRTRHSFTVTATPAGAWVEAAAVLARVQAESLFVDASSLASALGAPLYYLCTVFLSWAFT